MEHLRKLHFEIWTPLHILPIIYSLFQDGNKFSLLKPTQAIQTDSGEDENNEESEEIAGFSGGISPVFESNRTRSPSPVFPSQSLLATKKSAKRSLWKAR